MEEMKLELPEGDFKAYLFDCDGTIVDSMPLHYVAWKRALGEQGCRFPEEKFYAMGGMPVRAIIAALNEEHGLTMPVDQTAHVKGAVLHRDDRGLEGDSGGAGAYRGPAWQDSVCGGLWEARAIRSRPRCLLWTVSSLRYAGVRGRLWKGKPDPEPFLTAAGCWA